MTYHNTKKNPLREKNAYGTHTEINFLTFPAFNGILLTNIKQRCQFNLGTFTSDEITKFSLKKSFEFSRQIRKKWKFNYVFLELKTLLTKYVLLCHS